MIVLSHQKKKKREKTQITNLIATSTPLTPCLKNKVMLLSICKPNVLDHSSLLSLSHESEILIYSVEVCSANLPAFQVSTTNTPSH
jgi:hypothetical protein